LLLLLLCLFAAAVVSFGLHTMQLLILSDLSITRPPTIPVSTDKSFAYKVKSISLDSCSTFLDSSFNVIVASLDDSSSTTILSTIARSMNDFVG
jgi:hypothetical protein